MTEVIRNLKPTFHSLMLGSIPHSKGLNDALCRRPHLWSRPSGRTTTGRREAGPQVAVNVATEHELKVAGYRGDESQPQRSIDDRWRWPMRVFGMDRSADLSWMEIG
jgi:hypothetical protein